MPGGQSSAKLCLIYILASVHVALLTRIKIVSKSSSYFCTPGICIFKTETSLLRKWNLHKKNESLAVQLHCKTMLWLLFISPWQVQIFELIVLKQYKSRANRAGTYSNWAGEVPMQILISSEVVCLCLSVGSEGVWTHIKL